MNYEDFKEGRKVLRNAQDLAREHSTDLRERLHQCFERNPLSPTDSEDGSPASEGNSDSSPGEEAASPVPTRHSRRGGKRRRMGPASHGGGQRGGPRPSPSAVQVTILAEVIPEGPQGGQFEAAVTEPA